MNVYLPRVNNIMHMRDVEADDLNSTNDHNEAEGEKQTNFLST